MPMTDRRTLLSAAAALLLSGCAPMALAPDESVRTGRFSGRITFSGKTASASGRYRLIETPVQRRLEILTPLSGLLARIRVTASEAPLEKNGEIVARAPSSETLMIQTIGFSLAVSTLSAWLAGRPDPALAFEAKESEAFVQGGWTVRVNRRHASGGPAVIAARRPETEQAPGVSLSLTIEESVP